MMAKNVDTEYAFWTVPGTSFTITYSLGVLHEIDFVVNEGYRRIPHGGIETGGLLFGQRTENAARIQAFRTIECEHASGPSFVLSERDLDRLREQLVSTASDPELEGVEPIGWFIARTRSQLQLGDHEAKIFEEFFPSPGNITLLIKPERFQPTRFGFLVRDAERRMQRDAAQQAIILPLPERSPRAAEAPIPSISAPSVPADPVERGPAERPDPPRVERLPEPATPQPEPSPIPEPQAVEHETPPALPESTAIPEPKSAPPEPEPQPVSNLPAISPAHTWPSIDEIKRRRTEAVSGVQAADTRAAHQQITRKISRRGRRSNTGLVLVLALAAALGCAAGYWAYLRLPPAIVPLTVHPHPPALIISWPSDQTRDVVYAAIRIDDGEPLSLSEQDKAAGQTEINTTGDNMKVELIVRHLMRDSRGIIRFVTALKPPPSPPPVAPEPSKRGSRRLPRPLHE